MKSPAGPQCIISIKVVLSNSKINKLAQESRSAFWGVFQVPYLSNAPNSYKTSLPWFVLRPVHFSGIKLW